MINFYEEGEISFSSKGKKGAAKMHIKTLLEMEGKEPGDISFIFCTDDVLLDINRKYLGHDYYTDVITFDYTDDNVVSGDIFVSIERVEENACEFSVSFNHELSRVMYHGVLHLCGYKDETETEKQTMKEKEDFYLKTLSTVY
jgi:rRNA maturation RNase YbeY